MVSFDNVGAWVFSLIATFTAIVSGYITESISIMIALMGLDIATGILKGFKYHRLKSAIMHMGLLKKAGSILAIVFAILLDNLLNDSQPVFQTLMVWLVICHEGLSIKENLTALGVHIPTQMVEKFTQSIEESKKLQKEKDIEK